MTEKYGTQVISENLILSERLRLRVLLFLTDNMYMKKLIVIFITLLFMSCAKEETLTEVSIDFNQFATVSGSDFPTILLYGVSASGSTFTRILDSGYFSSEIPSDVWDFHVIYWYESNVAFTGKSSCASALGVDLSSGEVDVDLSVSSDNCSKFSSRSGDEFKNPKIKIIQASCTSDIVNCTPIETSFSLKYIVTESNNSNLLDSSVSSECVTVTGNSFSDINIIGEKKINHSLIGAFKVFEGVNCDSTTSSKIVTVGGDDMTTVNVSGDVNIYIKI